MRKWKKISVLAIAGMFAFGLTSCSLLNSMNNGGGGGLIILIQSLHQKKVQ